MFEFFFQHPPAVFRKGEFVLLGSWPAWVLAALILAAGAALAWRLRRTAAAAAPGVTRRRMAAVWAIETAVIALVLVMLWRPAMRIATLKPQQNIVAVVVDDSRSMAIQEGSATRLEQAAGLLSSGLLDELDRRFQVRLYRLGAGLERIQTLEELSAADHATRIGAALNQIVSESGSLPIGAVVLVSDGADNTGGLPPETVAALRSRRLPVHTIGVGRLQFDHDVEITDVQTPDRALAGSRLTAQVTLRQRGFDGRKARLTVRNEGRVLATREVELAEAGKPQVETLLFHAGPEGAKRLEISVDPLKGEENPDNNTLARLVNIVDAHPRILYMEGEPRWEFKFIRRAIDEDPTVELVSILRTTQNKIYRQGIHTPEELEEGFPGRVDELFSYDGLIIGSVEAAYFTPVQQELIREFVDRRGGGLLFLGGRASLADGGYGASALADLLPVRLPSSKQTFHRDRAGVRLTPAGRDSMITRLVDDAEANAGRWEELPQLADYQEAGTPKPGATVLAELIAPGGRELPLLVTQHYGRGRVALFATGGSWRWQMTQPLEDKTHEIFWQQLLRWLVTGALGRVSLSVPRQMLFDEDRVRLTATVRDTAYAPVADARVSARILGPDGLQAAVELAPDPARIGIYETEWTIPGQGSYIAEVTAYRAGKEAGRDVVTFERMDGVAENFHAEQNRDLLERLASATGGSYYTPETAARLSDEISFSEAGVTVRETKDLWNMPILFLLLLALKSGEWYLRRKWGVV